MNIWLVYYHAVGTWQFLYHPVLRRLWFFIKYNIIIDADCYNRRLWDLSILELAALGFYCYAGCLQPFLALLALTTDTQSWLEALSAYLAVRLNPIPETRLIVRIPLFNAVFWQCLMIYCMASDPLYLQLYSPWYIYIIPYTKAFDLWHISFHQTRACFPHLCGKEEQQKKKKKKNAAQLRLTCNIEAKVI